MRNKFALLVLSVLLCTLVMSGCKEVSRGVSEDMSKGTSNGEKGKLDENQAVRFKGVSWSETDDEKYTAYNGDWSCVNRDKGGIYYSGTDKNRYLYYWKDGKRKLILKKWVAQMAYMDGKIYCLYDKSGKTYEPDVSPSYEGVIAEIDTKTGKYTELTKQKAKLLSVTKEGIYYEWCTGPDAKEQRNECGFYSFQDKKIRKISVRQDSAISQIRFGKYAVIGSKISNGEVVQYCVRDLETQEEQELFGEAYAERVGLMYRVGEKLLYALSDDDEEGSWTWWSLDMTNGEKKQIKAEEPERKVHQFIRFGDDKLYSVTDGGGEIAVYDEGKEELQISKIKETYGDIHTGYIMSQLMTDGKYLYTTNRYGYTIVLEVRKDGIYEIWSEEREQNGKKK